MSWFQKAKDLIAPKRVVVASTQEEEPEMQIYEDGDCKVVLMTAEDSERFLKKHGAISDPDMQALAASLMDEHMRERKQRFDEGKLASGEAWSEVVSESKSPVDYSKLNQSLAIRRKED